MVKRVLRMEVRSVRQSDSKGPVSWFALADIDIATALFLAARLFPQGSDGFPAGAYHHEASQLSSSILRHCIHADLYTPYGRQRLFGIIR